MINLKKGFVRSWLMFLLVVILPFAILAHIIVIAYDSIIYMFKTLNKELRVMWTKYCRLWKETING
jgi:predicted PurR-regulated permease PerM